VDHLFSVIARLKKKGISTLFISHKLSEVFEIAEVVTILRDGAKVGDFPASELDDRKLTFLMTGQRIEYTPYRVAHERTAAPLLEVRGLSRKGQYEDISFSLWPGEILGLIGLIGSGRTELALSLFGLNPADEGQILMDGMPVRIRSPQEATRLGIGYLPEDRLNQGLFTGQSIGDNIVITVVKKLLGALGLIDPARRRKTESRWIEELAIKAPSSRVHALSLSGGNQQRVVLAKWLATDPKVFILDGPTIGIDIASKRNIHEIIRTLAERGIAIIMITDEVPEILHTCNRVLVMREGGLAKEIPDSTAVSEADLLTIIGGKKANGAVQT
jgi:simple sugar transport system ATP-binding protein